MHERVDDARTNEAINATKNMTASPPATPFIFLLEDQQQAIAFCKTCVKL
jgi:hypothetical protein